MHGSEGTTTFNGTLQDIASAWQWLRSPGAVQSFDVDTTRLALGGHSFGGGLSLAYAARDTSVRTIVSVAGTDHGVIIRRIESDEDYAEWIKGILRATQAPSGPVRFSVEGTLQELSEGQSTFGLQENASRLADRSILLIGGWEDRATTIDEFMLPLYRSLADEGAEDVTFMVYHDNHGFATVRDELAADIARWLLLQTVPASSSDQ
jgi:acetyl esterase/lipase